MIDYQIIMLIELIVIILILFYVCYKGENIHNRNEKEYEEYVIKNNKEYEEWKNNFKYWGLVKNLRDIEKLSKDMGYCLENEYYPSALNWWEKLEDHIEIFKIVNEKELEILLKKQD